MRYHIFDPLFPRKSKTAGFYCDCGMETREVTWDNPRKCNLATLRRAHIACRCPLWRVRDIRPKKYTWQKTMDDFNEKPVRDRRSKFQRDAREIYAVGTPQL